MKNKNIKPLYEVIAEIFAPISPQNPNGCAWVGGKTIDIKQVPYKTKEKIQDYMGKIVKSIVGVDFYTDLEYIIRKNAKDPDMKEVLRNIYRLTDAGNQTEEPSIILKEAKTGATLVLGLEKLFQRIHAAGGDVKNIKTHLERSIAFYDKSFEELGNFVRGLRKVRYNREELFAFGENDPNEDRYEKEFHKRIIEDSTGDYKGLEI